MGRIQIWAIVLILLMSTFLLSQVNTEEFASRREALMQKLDDGVIILRGATLQPRNNDVEYKFRQKSDFYYLSAFDEPDATMIIMPGDAKNFILFVKPNDPRMAIWVGESYGVHGAMNIFKADTAYSKDLFEEKLKTLLRGKEKVYFPFDDLELIETVLGVLKSSWGMYPKKTEDVRKHIGELRLIKSTWEVEQLQKSIDITVEAQKEAMQATKAGLFEYEIDALINYVYLKNGSPRVGFPSIVGSGVNSTILHYQDNDYKMKNGDVVVMDIGAEFGMYSADVTRTIPVNGKFSKEQADIYQIVLDAQNAGIEKTKPGIGIGEVHETSARVIQDGLLELGLITDKNSRWQTRVWFMHGVSHWLGLDTHDAGGYSERSKKGRILEEGMVFTVEPGIYVAPKALENIKTMFRGRVSAEEIDAFIESVKPAFEKYKNIGVRIEDDILVTKDGYRNLSKEAPREIDAIEKLMAKKSSFVKN
ncbi:MAG: M24 family metallopeptidase [Calditrichaeota bacterium]|nr:MAG: M24 family metallopeptidase [Calditrichota bacterium]MBL1204962.1 M24 family metallopeptidase [Calditrichota bacterium]NOG44792.1 M24 family metallopeptidase [Calditrichota bacterium]